jgi:delta14-sterol reductase
LRVADLVLPITLPHLVTAAEMLLGFVAALFVGALLLPGLERRGYPQPDGSTKSYSLTGMTLFFVAHVAVAVAVLDLGVSLTPIVAYFANLFVVANVVAIAITAALYARGRRDGVLRSTAFVAPFRPSAVTAPGPGADFSPPAAARNRHTRFDDAKDLVRDLWFGNELNPTWLGVDVKMFLYQPSLLGVNLVVAGFASADRDLHGAVRAPMLLLLAFWCAYLFTHYVKEEFMLSTWDVTSENFGFMLVWGDLVYVPFLYSLPCWWVASREAAMSTAEIAALVVVFTISLAVFREANWQKERYKRDPSATIWGKPPELVGGKLLASGFWGIGRKLNYTGEIGVYVCFALTAGFASPWPYLLPLSLVVLLVQRAARDDKKCSAKYGDLWQAYCARARFRMLPFVY